MAAEANPAEQTSHLDPCAPSFSILVQSQQSMTGGTPMKEDSILARKNKRKRTSPQDHAILEAAYQKNSKPDKNERVELVLKVQLSEKEVQIWFQNRRQNDRRRSKPLEPHELIAHIRGTANTPPTLSTEEEPTSTRSSDDVTRLDTDPHAQLLSSSSPGAEDARLEEDATAITQQEPASSTDTTAQEENSVQTQASTITQTPPSSVEVIPVPTTEAPTQQASDGESSSSSGRKRSHHEMLYGEIVQADKSPCPQEEDAPKKKDPLKRSSSVRLSMTAEGAVKIRTKDELTPSPEKVRPQPPESNVSRKNIRPSRSISMFEDVDPQRKGTQPHREPRLGPGFGRSRDARTWEFYCDSKAKDVLSEQAEAERSGSAVGAINLIRSSGHKARGPALSPLLSRGNVRPVSANSKSKAKLARAQSSLARLQSDGAGTTAIKSMHHDNRYARSPSGDSDKENWAPGTRTSHNALRRVEPSTSRRPVLQDSDATSYANPSQRRTETTACISPQHGRSDGEEMACVKGLLSLSQAAWR